MKLNESRNLLQTQVVYFLFLCLCFFFYVSFHLKRHHQSIPNEYFNALVKTGQKEIKRVLTVRVSFLKVVCLLFWVVYSYFFFFWFLNSHSISQHLHFIKSITICIIIYGKKKWRGTFWKLQWVCIKLHKLRYSIRTYFIHLTR